MSACYTNQFLLETQRDIVRIVFNDERASIGEGLPKAVKTVAEVVLTRENAQALSELLMKALTLPKG